MFLILDTPNDLGSIFIVKRNESNIMSEYSRLV